MNLENLKNLENLENRPYLRQGKGILEYSGNSQGILIVILGMNPDIAIVFDMEMITFDILKFA